MKDILGAYVFGVICAALLVAITPLNLTFSIIS